MRRVLIVGGGYAGFYTAWQLEKRSRAKDAQITIVEPRPYMTYQPFLPEVVAGSVEPRHVAVSLRSNLRRTLIVPGRGLKTVEEAVAVRDQLLTAVEQAAWLPDGAERRRLLTCTVVGGGFTGAEVFGEMLSLASSLRKARVLVLWLVAFLFGRDIIPLPYIQRPRAAFLGALPAPAPRPVERGPARPTTVEEVRRAS